MRLSRRPEPFDSDDYIFELKIDGFRSLAYIENGHCDLVSRNGNTFRNFKDLAQWIGENLRVDFPRLKLAGGNNTITALHCRYCPIKVP
jgi:hypothetical protein